ncbi:MAG: HAMP domain-containing sensor histidine kinase [Campylobacterota bacterium]|nr:HAMP domain-containing sensor histidine kinase [Campylobacterota bacterium]
MLVLKNRDTNSLLRSEKKSLLRFLTLYLLLVTLLLTLLSLFYYQSQEKLMFSNQRTLLSTYAYEQIKRLKTLHHYFDERRTYPRDHRFKSAIYDMEEVEIFSLIDNAYIRFDEEIYQHGEKIYYVKILDNYYLGAKYLIIEVEDSHQWYRETLKTIIIYSFGAFIILFMFSLLLAKLFLKPMRDSIVLLDRFIKDTTHELNTPLSTILANIEMMDRSVMVEKNRKKLDRITIAAKTVSVLYEDLTYLTLEHERENDDELLDLKKIIEERIEYFKALSKSKQINMSYRLKGEQFLMDRKKFIRIIDNLISNAIKYNRRGGFIKIALSSGVLEIEDSGIGIDEEKIPFIFDRYMRFNSSEGGFGVGLSIVKKIVDEYNMNIEVDSKLGIGTRMVLTW